MFTKENGYMLEEWEAWNDDKARLSILGVPETPEGSSIGDTRRILRPSSSHDNCFSFANSPSVIMYFAKHASTSQEYNWKQHQFIPQSVPWHAWSLCKWKVGKSCWQGPSWLQSYTRHSGHALIQQLQEHLWIDGKHQGIGSCPGLCLFPLC